jgi:hypothetical protein
MTHGNGGRILEHRMTFEGYFRSGTVVELRGPCYSACILLLAYMEKANLCIAPGAFMAFHAARGERRRDYMPGETRTMYESYPPEVCSNEPLRLAPRERQAHGARTPKLGEQARNRQAGRDSF